MKLQVKVIPSSSRDALAGWLGDVLKIKVKAPPEKGRANRAVIKFLEKQLQLPRGSISISSGSTSSRKTLEITTDNPDRLLEKLHNQDLRH